MNGIKRALECFACNSALSIVTTEVFGVSSSFKRRIVASFFYSVERPYEFHETLHKLVPCACHIFSHIRKEQVHRFAWKKLRLLWSVFDFYA